MSTLRWLRLAIILAALLPLAFFAAAAYSDYRTIHEAAWTRSQRAAQIGQEHASRVLEINEVIARQVLHNLGESTDAEIRAQEWVLHRQLKNLAEGLAHVQSITVWSAQGRPLVGSRVFPSPATLDISDREYFKFHKAKRDTWFISEKLKGRLTGVPFIDVSTRRNLRGGEFGGVVSTTVAPDHFTQFYRTLESAEPGLSVSLLRADGQLLARWPVPEEGEDRLNPQSPVMKILLDGTPDGSLNGFSGLDGEKGTGAYRKVGSYPLYVVAGIGRGTLLQPWFRQMSLLAAVTLPASVALAFVSWVAMRRTRQELLSSDRLKRESDQRLKAETALRQAQKLEALGQLTGGVAHDFNNLLMVVDSNLQLLSRLVPQTAGSTQIAAINRAVTGGTRLTRQLLAFSRRQAVTFEVLEVNEAVPAMMDLLRTSLGSSIRFKFVAGAESAHVRVDPAELELALLNLTINARDAMPNGGELTIATHNVKVDTPSADLKPGHYLVLTVTDTGPGVSEANLARVFEPFFTTKKPGQGSGLGLSQVYGFCLQAGGVARMASPGRAGAVVYLYLPVAPAPAKLPVAVESRVPDRSLRGSLLLVEDNLDIAEATKPLIEAMGCSVVYVPSADAALETLGEGARFDVVLSDILMPGSLNGLDLAMMLRHQYPSLPVLLMTGFAEQTGQAMASGFQVLAKPVSAASLATAIGAAIRLKKAGARAMS